MMKPTEQLMHEHEAIKLVLAVLEKLGSKLSSGMTVDAADMDGILEFITVFSDRCHHGKEEGFLFPALIAAGLPGDGGPIAVMLSEHEQGRSCVKQMIECWRRYQAGDKAAARQLAEAAAGYIELLNAHIQKENTVLFPIAERVLSAETGQKILDEFERFEVEKIGAGKHEQFHQMLGRLRQAYLP
jgi:hemerythrin-like domain-containing protein